MQAFLYGRGERKANVSLFHSFMAYKLSEERPKIGRNEWGFSVAALHASGYLGNKLPFWSFAQAAILARKFLKIFSPSPEKQKDKNGCCSG